jgi:hypothetical protein
LGHVGYNLVLLWILELVPACTSLYQLVQAQKVGKVARVKARLKISQKILAKVKEG